MTKKLLLLFVCLASLMGAHALHAQALEIDIVDGNASALPIAVVPFDYRGAGMAPETRISNIVEADLNRSGQFRSLPAQDVIERPSMASEVNFPTWRLLKQDFLLIGNIEPAGNGAYRVEFELFDVAKQQSIMKQALMGRSGSMRDVAHQIADAVYEKILGVRGAFWTRIAYITASGVGKGAQYTLVVADSDGYNPQTIVRSNEPLLSPAWSPDGQKLAYVSFERGNSAIYVQNLSSGARQLVSSEKGINSAPAFSPDGRLLAMTLSKGGNPDVYVMDLGSKQTRKLTNHWGIDTEAKFSADGRWIYFTSDRAGQPQIYRVGVGGGSAERITYNGGYNASVSLCCNDQKMAVARGGGNVYRIALVDKTYGGKGQTSQLSPGNMDESPSFAPNGSMVLYASREGKRGVLFAVSADARVRQRLISSQGDVREPAWSPYRQR